jgi:hypothetical protein
MAKGTSTARGWSFARAHSSAAGWRHIHPEIDRVSARRWVPSGPARPNVDDVSADPAAKVALATLRRARAQQEAAQRWLRRLTPPLFVVVAVVVFTSGRNPSPPSRDVGTAIAVTGLALGVLSVLKVRHRRAAVRIIFAVMLLASSAALTRLHPDGPGLAGLPDRPVDRRHRVPGGACGSRQP